MEEKEKGAAMEPTTKHRGWKAMPYVIGNETFEKLGTLGTSSNLLVYLTTVFHLKSATAATLVQVLTGTTNLAPVFGAFLSDTYLGRYWTLGFASMSSFTVSIPNFNSATQQPSTLASPTSYVRYVHARIHLWKGMLLLTLTAAVSNLHPPRCDPGGECAGPDTEQLVVLFASFAFLVVGAGGIRPCNLAFGADQFDPGTESGKKGISSFFNWYYFTFTFAMMVSATVIIWLQTDVSWPVGLAVPTVLMFFSCAVFFLGTKIYVRVKPEGSPFTNIARVLVAASRKRGLESPGDPRMSLFNPPHKSALISKLPYTEQFRFLDKAAIITPTDEIKPDGSPSDPWRLCSIQQVEEVKCLARIIPVWSTGIIYYVAVVQLSTYVVFQALQSDRRLGDKFQIPGGTFIVFNMLALTIWIPIYDRLLVPWLRTLTKKGGGLTLLQRMGIGLVLSILTMVVAALVEDRRRSYALHRPTIGIAPGGGAVSSMSCFWLVPQLALSGLSEGFNLIGQVEFYYKQFPENMRSVAGSLMFLTLAGGSYLSGLIVTVIHKATGGDGRRNWLDGDLNKGRLDYVYFFIAVIGVLNLMFFITCARWYRYKGSDGPPEIEMEKEKSNTLV